jgi:large subunit ribosomal protein L16
LVLRPRKFIYKSKFKRRTIRNGINSPLSYGHVGLKVLQPLQFNSKQLFRLKILIKKSSRKYDRTKRKVWLNTFPHLPITRKVSGSRMGKGKGKLSGWCSRTAPGINLVEFYNLRLGRALYYCKQVKHRIPVQSRVVRVFSIIKVPMIVNHAKKIGWQTYLN